MRALGIKGIHQCASTSASTPRARRRRTSSASPTSRTSGQEGIELAFKKDLAGRDGSRRVIKDRLGRVVEDVGEQVPPVDGQDIQLAIDRKVQFFAYQSCATRWPRNKAKAGSVVVLDAQHRRGAGAGQLPELRARPTAQNLTGEQLRNRALTDTFEPGSTMKPFIVALGAGDRPRHAADHDPDRARPDHARPARRSPTRTARRR